MQSEKQIRIYILQNEKETHLREIKSRKTRIQEIENELVQLKKDNIENPQIEPNGATNVQESLNQI